MIDHCSKCHQRHDGPCPSVERIAAALALAEDAVRYELEMRHQGGAAALSKSLVDAYIATAPKLRTRAEVDREIGIVAREWHADTTCSGPEARALEKRLAKLCAEPTADPQPYGSSSDRVDSPPRVDAAAGAAYSGPRPTPATKESSDTAGVEAGAANRITDHDADQREASHPDDRPCGCEDTDELRAEIAVLRAKISDCANHAQGGMGSDKFPSCMGETACRWIYQRLTNP